VHGGQPIVLADAANPMGGAWWGPERILFAANEGFRLFWVPASGGETHELEMSYAEPFAARAVLVRTAPRLLPGNEHFLFSDFWYGSFAYSFESGLAVPILQGATSPRYVDERTLLFTRGSDLMAVAFDPEQLRIVSEASIVAEAVRVESEGAAQFAASANGLVAFAPGNHVREGSLATVSLEGDLEALPFARRIFSPMVFSPTGEALAIGVLEATWDIWVFDLRTGTRKRMTREGNNQWPAWSSDGRTIYFSSDRGPSGTYSIYSMDVHEARDPTPVFQDADDLLLSAISKDGGLLATRIGRTLRDLHLLPSGKGQGLVPLEASRSFVETLARFSPDDRWVAYTSDETGSYEVYVRPTSGKGRRVRLTSEGGEEPVWSPSGDRIYFRNGSSLMAVPIRIEGSSIVAGEARPVFDDPAWTNLPGHSYEISPDGSRFLIVRSEAETTAEQIHLIEGLPASAETSARPASPRR
jgi:WD40 repeat protein